MKEPHEGPGEGGNWPDLFTIVMHTWNSFFEGD